MDDTSPYPQAPFIVPPLPEKVTATTTHGLDKTTEEPGARQLQYYADLAKQRQDEEGVVHQQAEQDKKNAEVKAADAQALVHATTEHEKLRAAAYQKTQDDIEQWSTRLKDARDKFDNAKTPSLFHDGDTYGNVMKGLALVLGAGSDALRARIGVMTGRDQ